MGDSSPHSNRISCQPVPARKRDPFWPCSYPSRGHSYSLSTSFICKFRKGVFGRGESSMQAESRSVCRKKVVVIAINRHLNGEIYSFSLAFQKLPQIGKSSDLPNR